MYVFIAPTNGFASCECLSASKLPLDETAQVRATTIAYMGVFYSARLAISKWNISVSELEKAKNKAKFGETPSKR